MNFLLFIFKVLILRPLQIQVNKIWPQPKISITFSLNYYVTYMKSFFFIYTKRSDSTFLVAKMNINKVRSQFFSEKDEYSLGQILLLVSKMTIDRVICLIINRI